MPLQGAGRRIVGGWKRFIRQGLAGTQSERAMRASTVQTVNVLSDGRSLPQSARDHKGFGPLGSDRPPGQPGAAPWVFTYTA